MKSLKLCKALITAALIGVTTLGSVSLVGAQQGGYGMGPGMMGGQGYGMGPGMMGGYGPGYGMPGMMGGQGYGMGPGMMGGQGYGMGPGMMGGYGMLHQLNLTPEQWTKVNAIQEELAKKSWEIGGKAQEEGFKLRNLMFADKRDRAAILSQFRKLQELRLQGFQARLDAHDKTQASLTVAQKDQLRRFAPW